MNEQAWLALGLFVIVYAFIITEKIHRTIAALLGALVMIVFGILDQETAIHHIDFNTLGLLIGMMIIVAITAETGLFNYIAIWSAKKAKGSPLKILLIFSAITAGGSAFLDNVTTVLLIVPVTFSITRRLQVPAFPYLISEVLMSNIGGTATMIGDPPNIMIGSAVKELTFNAFIANLTAISGLIAIVVMLILAGFYRKQLKANEAARVRLMALNERDEITDVRLLVQSLSVLALTIAGFFLHQTIHLESASVALIGAVSLLLMTGERQLERALMKIEWPTIFFFIGLFVLVGGLVETGVIDAIASKAMDMTGGDVAKTSLLVLWLSALASAFVDNIPFVATMIPMIKEMGELGLANPEPVWWSLALGACLGGNGTLIGASANVIVAGLADHEGHDFSFMRFLKIGFPLMILTVIMATVYVFFRYLA